MIVKVDCRKYSGILTALEFEFSTLEEFQKFFSTNYDWICQEYRRINPQAVGFLQFYFS